MEQHSQIEIVETLPVIVWTARPDGVVDFISSDLEDLTGPHEVPPEQWLDHVHPDDHEPTVEIWREAVESGEPYEAQFRLASQTDEAYRWHLVQARALQDGDGRITKWFGVALDIHDRFHIATALAEAREQTRLILESSGEGIHGVDRNGKVTFTNTRALEILGHDLDSLIGRSSHATIHHCRRDGSDFPREECPIYQTLEDGKTRVVDDDAFIARDGSFVPVAYTVAAIRDPERRHINGAVVNFRDTRLERRERLLRDMEARVLRMLSSDRPLRQIFDTINRCIEEIDHAARASILLVEGEQLRLASAPSLPEAVNRAIDGIVAGPNTGSCGTAVHSGRPVISADISSDERWRGYRELARENGLAACWSTPVMDAEGRALATFAIYYATPCEPSASDLALLDRVAQFAGLAIERFRQRRELRASEERFRAVATATSDVIWDWDMETDRLWWSDGIEAQFKYRRDELPEGSDSWTFMIHPDDRDRVLASIRAAIDGTGSDWNEEYRMLTADQCELLVQDRGRIIRDDRGRAVRMVGSMVDITNLRRLEQQLQQAQRLEAIGQLTGGVAHDFNNLLTVILGNAELLEDSLDRKGPLHDLAAMIRSAARQGADLTSRLLAFARKQALEPEPTDVNRLVAGMDQLLRRSLGETVELELIRAGGLWPAIVDPGQLEAALLNLSINARDAMPEGGKLTIETANARLDDEYAAAAVDVTPGQYIQISISDTGLGMDAETLAQAFEPFFTTKKADRGSGLGLSMVYGFVSQSGGHIRIYSEPGQGTTVKIYLPRSDETRAVNPRELPRGSRVESGSETLLVVEDNDLVRRHVERQLLALGYTVVTAADGVEALTILESDRDLDLLFTDVVMPGGLSGRELADRARALRPELPVLYTSGYTENAIVHHGRLDRGVHLLQKPYRREELAQKIRRVLDETASA